MQSFPSGQRFIESLPVWALRLIIPPFRRVAGASKRRYLLLIEDLAPACNGDQVVGCSAEQVDQAIRGLAAFHASYWCEEALVSKIWLPPVSSVSRAYIALHRRSRRRFYRRHGDAIPDVMKQACRWMDAHCEAVMAHLASPPFTVVHGDYRLDNLFFDGGRVLAVDFQAAARGRPGLDLAYFALGSVDAGIRDSTILDVYCEELVALGIEGYTREECERDYTLGKFFQAYLHTSSDDFIDFSEGRGRRLIEVMRGRMFARLPEPPYEGLL